MTLVSSIIQDAYRESNLIALEATPSANQTTEGLRRLNALISALIGFEVGDDLLDWPIGNENLVANTTWQAEQWTRAVQNVRIIPNLQQATTVFLPPDPDDGARIAMVDPRALTPTYPITLDGNGRLIAGATTAVLNTGNSVEYMYRADLAQWVVLTIPAADTEEMPFPAAFDDYFISKLAMRLNPRYGRSIAEETAVMLANMENKLRSRYHQIRDVPADLGAVFLTEGHDRNYRAQGTSRGRNSWMN